MAIAATILAKVAELVTATVPTSDPHLGFVRMTKVLDKERTAKSVAHRHYTLSWADGAELDIRTCDIEWTFRKTLTLRVWYQVPNAAPAGDIQSVIEDDADQLLCTVCARAAAPRLSDATGQLLRIVGDGGKVVTMEAGEQVALLEIGFRVEYQRRVA